MPRYDFHLTTIIQSFENDSYLAEALFFPEVSRLDDRRPRLENAVKLNAARIAEDTPPRFLHSRHAIGPMEQDRIQMVLDPPPKSVAWRNPLRLEFDIVRYAHGEQAVIAYVPALGIEVVARDAGELQERLPASVRAHLLRL